MMKDSQDATGFIAQEINGEKEMELYLSCLEEVFSVAGCSFHQNGPDDFVIDCPKRVDVEALFQEAGNRFQNAREVGGDVVQKPQD